MSPPFAPASGRRAATASRSSSSRADGQDAFERAALQEFAAPEAGVAEPQAGPIERPAGSGVIVHSDGYVLTAYHVVANAKRITVVTAGEFRAPAVVVSADHEHDLALLKIETVGLNEALLG